MTSKLQRSGDTATCLALAAVLGEGYGTDHLSMLMHAVVRMQRPHNVVELGTGLGASFVALGDAVRCNRIGHVTSVDDGLLLTRDPALCAAGFSALRAFGWQGVGDDAEWYLPALVDLAGLSGWVTPSRRHIDLANLPDLDDALLAHGAIDFAFSDFRHGSDDVVALLEYFLPRLAARSTLFVDSVPAALGPALLLTQIVDVLNSGRTPECLGSHWSPEERRRVLQHRFTYLELVEDEDRMQNSTAWIQLTPLLSFEHLHSR